MSALPMAPILIVYYLISCIIVGLIGSYLSVGFIGSFMLSVFISPPFALLLLVVVSVRTLVHRATRRGGRSTKIVQP